MILWLASYPKSGNTLLRSLLSSYFYTADGVFNFELLKNIQYFPSHIFYKNSTIDITNDFEVMKNYIEVQKKFIQNKKRILFLKTHSGFFRANNHSFTNLQNSLGAIYVVRDPRKVVVSYANHFQMDIDQATKALLSDTGTYERNTRMKTLCGKWNFNYLSWKKFDSQRLFLIKYEDMIVDKENTLKKILLFLNKLIQNKFEINQTKIKNIISSTSFEKMKDLEKQKSFVEASIDKKTGKAVPFFYLGDQKKSEKLLDKKNKDKIENAFRNEMEELGYL
jgi:hypothetical protein|tara:strand:+ start:209 stop:1045 length:837 start_codon:yes stop_codon:yes gene_type:complete